MARARKWSFSFEKTVIGVLIASLCYAMGIWQYNRYKYKVDYFNLLDQRAMEGVVTLDKPNTWEKHLHGEVRVEGEFKAEDAILIINRSHQSQPGMKWVVPLKLLDGRHILVDRGFIPFDVAVGDKNHLQIDGVTVVRGVLRPSQSAQFFIDFEKPAKPGTFKERWLRVDLDHIKGQFPYPLENYFIEQNNQKAGHGIFLARSEVPASRHMNYTIQWFSFGSFGFFLCMLSQWKRQKKGVSREIA